MRFRTSTPAPSYFSGGQQRRLLLLVLSLGLVVFLMREAGQPDRWKWFEVLAPGPGQVSDADAVDTRLPPVEPDGRAAATVRAAAEDADKVPLAGADQRFFPGVEAGLLGRVRDDTIFRKQDYESWFNLCRVLQDTPAAAIRAASTGPATFLQLYQQPAAYRGELVTIAGTVRRASYRAAPQNDQGIEGYHQVWLQASGTSSSLLVVFVLELPPGFPTGDGLEAEVTLTGFFFKRWAYAAQDTIRTAPVVLARTLEWQQPAAVATARQTSWWPYLGAAIVGTVLALLAVRFRTPRNQALDRYTDDSVGDIEPPPIDRMAVESFQIHPDTRPEG